MNVKIARIKIGLTQLQLCKKIKMSPSTLVKVEKGDYDRLTLAQMKALAKELKEDIQTLFFSD